MRLGELEVELLVGGEPAREYTDADFEQEPVQNAMSKYVEAVDGVSFAFRSTVHPRYKYAKNVDYLSIDYLVDGVKVNGSAASKRDHKRDKSISKHRNGYISKQGSLLQEEKFRFSKIKTTDESIAKAEAERQKEEYGHVGELQVDIWRKAGSLGTGLNPPPRKKKDLSDIHEKVVSQTAVSVGTKEDAPIEYKTGNVWSGKSIDLKPIAVFTFKYRDRASLHKLRIIEPSPTPIPLEDRDPDTLTPDELREAMRRMRAREKEQEIKIKKEKQEAALRQLAGIKREKEDDDEDDAIAEVDNSKKKAHIEVIDLLDDD